MQCKAAGWCLPQHFSSQLRRCLVAVGLRIGQENAPPSLSACPRTTHHAPRCLRVDPSSSCKTKLNCIRWLKSWKVFLSSLLFYFSFSFSFHFCLFFSFQVVNFSVAQKKSRQFFFQFVTQLVAAAAPSNRDGNGAGADRAAAAARVVVAWACNNGGARTFVLGGTLPRSLFVKSMALVGLIPAACRQPEAVRPPWSLAK